MLKIKNLKTGKVVSIVRDVCHTHPDWVHGQCSTFTESQLQEMLDQTSEQDYVGQGPDVCGIFWEE